MDIRGTIESVAREVIQLMINEKNKQKKGKVLFIFCDSTAHEPFQDELIKLNNHNISYDLLFLDGETSSWLGLHHIECNGAGKVIATDENAPAPIELPKDYDAIIVPEIDLDNAARITAGMKGTVKAEIVFSGLLLNKPILFGEDVPGIKRSDRRCLNQLSLTNFYQSRFQDYISQLKEMGIEFRPQKELIDSVIGTLGLEKCEDDSPKLPFTENKIYTFNGKVLTADWVQSQKSFPEQVVYLPKGVIVSPLAKDLLKDKGLTIHHVQ